MIPEAIFIETLLELLAPVRQFLDDPTVTEILINGPSQIYIERRGKLDRADATFGTHEALLAALRNIAQFAGKRIDEAHPILEARLPDGSRVQAVLPPASFGGASVAIRRFSKALFTIDKLVETGALTRDAAAMLEAFVGSKLNVIVAGGTGSGKTSLLNALSTYVPSGERIIVIEDSKEVQLQQEHVVYLEARPANAKGQGEVKMRDLFRSSLRMRPDRIVIGEIRGGEALEIIQAMVSGHGGCMGTLHATYPRDTLTRLETMALMSDVELPLAALRLQIASGINLIVQVGRYSDGSRKVTHITEVQGYDMQTMKYQLQDIFIREFRDRDEAFGLRTELVPTGAIPDCVHQMRQHGWNLPTSVQQAAERLRMRSERGEARP